MRALTSGGEPGPAYLIPEQQDLPHTCRSQDPLGAAQLGGKPTFAPDFLHALT
jgi:hypothetical protein